MTVRARTSGTALAAGVIVLVAGVVGGCSSPGSDPVATTSATGTAVLQDAVQVRAIPGVFAKLRRERQLEAVVMVAVEYFGDRLQQRGVDQRGVVGAS